MPPAVPPSRCNCNVTVCREEGIRGADLIRSCGRHWVHWSCIGPWWDTRWSGQRVLPCGCVGSRWEILKVWVRGYTTSKRRA